MENLNLFHVIDMLLLHCDKRLLRSNLQFSSGYWNMPEMAAIHRFVDDREARIKEETGIAADDPITLQSVLKVWAKDEQDEAEQAANMQRTVLALGERQREKTQRFIERARDLMAQFDAYSEMSATDLRAWERLLEIFVDYLNDKSDADDIAMLAAWEDEAYEGTRPALRTIISALDQQLEKRQGGKL